MPEHLIGRVATVLNIWMTNDHTMKLEAVDNNSCLSNHFEIQIMYNLGYIGGLQSFLLTPPNERYLVGGI